MCRWLLCINSCFELLAFELLDECQCLPVHQVYLQLLDEGLLMLIMGPRFLKLLLQGLYVTLLLYGTVLQLCQLCIQLPVSLLQASAMCGA